jgi:hypothetical protein
MTDQAVHSTRHQVRSWHDGHCIHRLYALPGIHTEIARMRTIVSTREILDRTPHAEHVITAVPASRGPAE